MNYALLVHVIPELLSDLSSEDKSSLHGEQNAAATDSTSVVAHYRLRPPRLVTTIRIHEDRIVKTGGPAAEAAEQLRALYVIESDEEDAALDFASRLPAVQLGGTVEVWPLIASSEHAEERRGHRWRRHH
jgi:hypothetical protein